MLNNSGPMHLLHTSHIFLIKLDWRHMPLPPETEQLNYVIENTRKVRGDDSTVHPADEELWLSSGQGQARQDWPHPLREGKTS